MNELIVEADDRNRPLTEQRHVNLPKLPPVMSLGHLGKETTFCNKESGGLEANLNGWVIWVSSSVGETCTERGGDVSIFFLVKIFNFFSALSVSLSLS